MTRNPLPPGPRSNSLMGSSPLAQGNPLAVFLDWTRTYGDIFSYRSLAFRIFFLNDPAAIETVLVTQSRRFIKGRGLQANRDLFGNGLLTSEGDFWRRQRRLAQPAFHKERIAAYGRMMVEFTSAALSLWANGERFDLQREMTQLTLTIVARALFATEVSATRDLMGRALAAVMERNLRGRMLIPVLRSLPTPVNLRYWRAIRQLDRIVYGIIAERRKRTQKHDDLLQMLLDAQDENGQGMTDRQLRDEVLTLMLAGHETTALALSWTFYLLATHPQVERRLIEEIHHALRGQTPTPDDFPRLPFTECVVKESMRLYPPAYILTRMAIEDCEVAGYVVPRGATVLISPWVMQRNPRFYQDPETFNPDRWNPREGGGIVESIPRFAYLPFGGGPRVCIGSAFALMEVRLMLVTILQRYHFELAPEPPVEPLPVITLRQRYGMVGRFVGREGECQARRAVFPQALPNL